MAEKTGDPAWDNRYYTTGELAYDQVKILAATVEDLKILVQQLLDQQPRKCVECKWFVPGTPHYCRKPDPQLPWPECWKSRWTA